MENQKSTSQPSAMCAALARSLMIWIKQDDVGHGFVAHQLAQFESIVSADMHARAEAAEAALIAKDEALNYCAYPNYCGGESENLLQIVGSRQDSARIALAITPAETRSVIAGLREEVTKLTERLSTRSIIIDGGFAYVRQLEAQRDALISAGEDLARYFRDHKKNPEGLASWDAAVSGTQAEAKGETSL